MTILSIAQDASNYLGIERPTALMASDRYEHLELASIANRAVDYIVGLYDWQRLSKIGTVTGDGTTTAFDLPADYFRFTSDASGEPRIVTPIMAGAMHRVVDLDEWLTREVRDIGRVTYSWIMYGGQIHIKPALPASVTASIFYQSKLAVSDGNIVPTYKSVINADGDVFLLDERMLMLCMVWMWKHSKGQAYAEYLADFERRRLNL